jgi:GntR family transcriptional regulator, carbon starvation induced regulator
MECAALDARTNNLGLLRRAARVPRAAGPGAAVPRRERESNFLRAPASGPDQKSPTLESRVRQQLRRDVLTGTYAPGQKLRILRLCEEYGVGASPIREALARLHSEGLVTAEDNKGFRVAPMSMGDLADLTLARQVIDTECFRLSIERGTTAWEAEVLGTFHQLERATSGRSPGFVPDIELWEATHKAFHRALIAACGSSTLLEIAERLYDRGARYRMLMATISLPSDRLVKEHRQLVEAALDRSADKGCELLYRHMQITGEIIAAGPGNIRQRHLRSAEPERGKPVNFGRNRKQGEAK